jgi:hypothetical protein
MSGCEVFPYDNAYYIWDDVQTKVTEDHASALPGTIVKGDTKKVDYTLCLELPASDLRSILLGWAMDQSLWDGTAAHVNHTDYVARQWNLMAVSIETKAAQTRDSMTQLGIWVPAWIKRMRKHQMRVFQSLEASSEVKPSR